MIGGRSIRGGGGRHSISSSTAARMPSTSVATAFARPRDGRRHFGHDA